MGATRAGRRLLVTRIRATRRGWLDGDIEAAEAADPGLALALRRASNFEGV